MGKCPSPFAKVQPVVTAALIDGEKVQVDSALEVEIETAASLTVLQMDADIIITIE